MGTDASQSNPIGFVVFNGDFSIPPQGSFVDGRTYAFEIDIAAVAGQVAFANIFRNAPNIEGPQQIWNPVVAGDTLRWQRLSSDGPPDTANGSITIAFADNELDNSNTWATSDSVDISAFRVYDLG